MQWNDFTYDRLGRTTKFTNSLGNSIELMWDARSNLIQVTDYNGNVSRFEYDRSNRLVKEVLPLGETTVYTHDAKGNRDTVTDPAGNTIRYVYDASDRPIRTEVTAAGESSASLNFTFAHDEEDNLTGWSDGSRSAAYTYDDEGRLLTETVDYGDGVTLGYAYTYTAAGYKQTLRYPDGTTVAYTHDLHGELSRIDIPGEGSISVNAWNWVAPQKVTLPGGATQELTHDGLLKLTGLKVKAPGQQTVFDLGNKYGKLEELKEKTITDSAGNASATVATQYTYDPELRLTQVVRDTGGLFGVGTESFDLDAAGNRIMHSAVSGAWVYDANNRLVQRGDTSYEYDAAGNLVTRAQGTGSTAASITRFKYDVLGRLIEVQDGASSVIAKYVYDPFDNRLVKEHYRDENGQVLATPRRTYYLYADEGLIAEADGAGNIVAQYGWKPDGEWATDPVFLKMPVVRNGSASADYAYFHNDHLGTPLRATDKTGDVLWRAEYSSFGQATLGNDNQLVSNLRLAGQYFDAETGLHYNTRRYYDPVIGRYISADPLGYAGGWNLYTYTDGDPVNQLDPTGEWAGVIRALILVYEVRTTYKEFKETGCFDWTTLVPLPIKIPRWKWVTKWYRNNIKCRNPCQCLMGGSGGNSFPADTLVHAQDESGNPALRPIASLKPGDKVLAKSEWKAGSESLSYERVTDVFVTPEQPRTLVHLTLEDGQNITATEGHPFKTTEGWRDAVLLKKGGKLLLMGDSETPGKEREVLIVGLRHEVAVLTTYNLEVANAHTFFVGTEGALVHNKKKVWVDKKGRTQVVITYPTRKKAKEAAERVGLWCGKPERHKRGGPHFHDKHHNDPTKPNVHYDFPDNQF